jgi:ERCC4-type nuclease
MFMKKFLFNTKSKLSKILRIFNKQPGELSDRCENLTSIPGIGTKNCNNFYEAGYMTPESIISASDEELLTIPGVGISFVKKLRETLGRL